MKNEVVLELSRTDDLSFLDPFGTVIFTDDLIDVVILECDQEKIHQLENHPFVKKVKEARTNGYLL